MNLFSLSKSSYSKDEPAIATIVDGCSQIARGNFSARIDLENLTGPLAEVAAAVNEAFESAEQRVTSLNQGVSRATEMVEQLRVGNFEIRLVGIQDSDPTAPLMHSLNDFADVTDSFVREAGASLDAVSNNIYYRKVLLTGLRGEFRRTAEHINHATAAMGEKVDGFTALTERLVDNIRSIAGSISEMNGSVVDVSTIADDASQRSTAVAAAVEETTTSLQSIAAAAEEMLVSAGEINRQVVHSTEITQDAAERMTESNAVAETLMNAANSINEVLDLISNIASQTNLLALNATIEAARAGDAGKGFAVVASEVKSLSSQTAKATEDISAQVQAMQSATSATVQTIERLGGTVNQINEISEAIAAAITEQEATTKEISANIQNAASGSQEVADNMQQVSDGAKKNSRAAESLGNTMGDLQKASSNLVDEATEFLDTARRTGTD